MSSPKKYWIPLESDPDMFNNLLRGLGAPPSLVCEDVLSFDFDLPHPTAAVIFTGPSRGYYNASRAADAAKLKESGKEEKDLDLNLDKDGLIWFKQTIGNACGFFALLHSLANIPARDELDPSSFIGRLVNECASKTQDERIQYLENSPELEQAYKAVCRQGISAPPERPEDVFYHYVAFVKSKSGKIYQMDGARNLGPIDCGVSLKDDEDVLSPAGVQVIKDYLAKDANVGYNVMALVKKAEEKE